MIALLQRVSAAEVAIADRTVARIGAGLLVFLGIERDDTRAHAQRLMERVLGYRVFADGAGKMNRSLSELGGGLLLVPQFTLAAATGRGLRPGFSRAATPVAARQLFAAAVASAERLHSAVAAGEFGADMAVTLTNDGPVTFWLQV